MDLDGEVQAARWQRAFMPAGTACGAASPAHSSVHVEPTPQSTPQLAISQRTAHVEPSQATVLEAPVIVTSQTAPSRQLTLALLPAVKKHVEPTHSGLALSPATTSQMAPMVQSALQELPHVAAHDAAVHARLQLEPSELHEPTLVQPQVIPVGAPAQVQAEPAHAH